MSYYNLKKLLKTLFTSTNFSTFRLNDAYHEADSSRHPSHVPFRMQESFELFGRHPGQIPGPLLRHTVEGDRLLRNKQFRQGGLQKIIIFIEFTHLVFIMYF